MRRIGCILVPEMVGMPALTEAHQALLDVALAHSPRVEEGPPGLVFLDVAGLGSLFGDEPSLARRLLEQAATRGLGARVGIAGSRIAALLSAWDGSGEDPAVIPPGREGEALGRVPLAVLGSEGLASALPPGGAETVERLRRWGLRTLGDLAALPAAALFERLGAEGLRLQALARGEDPRPLAPWQPPPVVEERRQCDWGVEALDALLALFADLAHRACAGLASRGLVGEAFEWECRGRDPEALAGAPAEAQVAAGTFVPAVPVSEPRAILTALRTALESSPPRAPVTAVSLRARPVRLVPVQEHLTDRARPAPRDLAGTLARVEALVGSGRVGTPVLLDSHRPDPVRMEAFHMNLVRSPRPSSGSVTSLRPDALPSGPARRPALAAMAPETSSPESGPPGRPGLAVRRLRPPVPARVRLVGGRPVHLASARLGGAIVASAGPWRTSGEWWGDRPFLRDEWDVELADGTLCRLAHDGRGWALDAVYD